MTGRAVGPDFRLPWNTTRTMADVWTDDREAMSADRSAKAKRSWPARRARQKIEAMWQRSEAVKHPYAGREN